MATRWNPFDRPQPTADCLMHEAVLVQAWKKSHAYIRSRNWYADVLELDLSAANLKAEIERWTAEYEEDGLDALRPERMRLVPAPKAGKWIFQEDSDGQVRWRPEIEADAEIGKTERPVLRPLAHLSIRDQTLATAAMICVADVVETAQGDCTLPASEARARGVVSYGNRLFCEWTRAPRKGEPDEASFGWGNANSYRKYYADYRAFLQRPRDVCAEAEPTLHPGEELGVVSLDLASFYDRIKPTAVIGALKKLCKQHRIPGDEEFWRCLRRIFSWRWAKDSIPVTELLRDGTLPGGLPQGLVASGFFSNAYMLAFDETVRDALSDDAADLPFAILDYCRYVDDMRFVVRWQPSKVEEGELTERCTGWVNELLAKDAKCQACNAAKSEYVPYRDLRSKSGRAATMELVQRQLSGPIDMEAIEEVSVALDGLLRALEFDAATDQRLIPEGAPPLARVFATTSEVRDDTLKRFATYRQFKLLRERRQRAGDDETVEGRLERQQVDADIEIAARRMVWFWSEDPSLGIVLRHGMNLWPTPDLLEPVLAELRRWITASEVTGDDAAPHWVCWYAAADILKAGVIETGHSVPPDALPVKSDLPGYREVLANFAEELLERCDELETPWYVLQQAIMFLVSVGRHVAISKRFRQQGLAHYVGLIHAVRGRLDKMRDAEQWVAPLLIVAHQFEADETRVVSRLARWLRDRDADDAVRIAENVYLAQPELLRALLDHTGGKPEHTAWRERLEKSYVHLPRATLQSLQSLRRKWVPLTSVAATADNPFRHENAALRLLIALVDRLNGDKTTVSDAPSPHAVLVSCPDWSKLRNPCWKPDEVKLALKLSEADDDPRYALPAWCVAERRPFMIVGRLLRAAVTGESDYTAPAFFAASPREGYQGVRTSWYKRQYGMFHRPDALGGPQASCSPWLAELLAKLLQWPGCRESDRMITDWSSIRTLDDLQVLAIKRLERQACVYAKACELPVYVHPVNLALKCPPMLTTVLIQTVRPWRRDFASYGASLASLSFRPIRRAHLAALLRLAEKLLGVRGTCEKDVRADLILLPECSVHEDDLDLIERLVDRTRAMAFCGLVFRSLTGVSGLVNTARWIIPDYGPTGRSLVHIDQGKQHLTKDEASLGIQPWRPHQVIIELRDGVAGDPYRLSGSVCYDATDLRLAADLKNVTDMLIVPANNQDVTTFDAMTVALSYHMYQHVVVVNTGEFGGTAVMAPYEERYERVLTHHHGGGHASVAVVDIDLSDYQQSTPKAGRRMKTPPAGYGRH